MAIPKAVHAHDTQPEELAKSDSSLPLADNQILRHRLSQIVQSRLLEFKALSEKARVNLKTVEESLPEASAERAIVSEFRGYAHAVRENVLPELLRTQCLAGDEILLLRGMVHDLKRQLQELHSSRTVRFIDFLHRAKKKLFRPAKSSPTRLTFSANVFADINNSGTALDIFPEWHSVFHFQGKRYGSSSPGVNDAQQNFIDADKIISFRGKRILELGCLEACNTKELLDLGAREVTAIEANEEAFLKSLIVKNEFGLDNAHFLYGDCNKILAAPEFRGQQWFDVCLAFGILYHMQDPLFTLDLITTSAPVLFVWTQVASAKYPRGPWTELQDSEQRKYRAKKNVYKASKHIGGVADHAYWLTEESLLQALDDRGFEIVELSRGQTGSGDRVTFIAKRKDVVIHRPPRATGL